MPSIVIIGMGPGVSAGVARRFGREGFTVAAVARRREALAEHVQALTAAGVRAKGFAANAADPASLQSVLADIAREHGTPDVLVYNAAGVTYKPLAQLTPQELSADLQTSIVGAFAAAQAVLPAMKERGSGTILLTGGGFAFEPMPALAGVGVGKAGIRNLAFSLFADLKDTGVHAATVTICGMVKPGTPFDPDRIAEAYWALHQQPKGAFEREIQFRG
ncbi:MAG TPA: SDR family NAD(P)-dependent oxidoreductase [Ramlibacter sp.]|nr:SDR family NAD(P)-dependent oxidoreductase [Ramlibacter sp.]